MKGLGQVIELMSSLRPASKEVAPALSDILVGLPEPLRSVLASMYTVPEHAGCDGKSHRLDKSVRISPEQGMWMYELCRRVNPKRTFEIGLAYGFSTCFILAAHAANGGGQHVACDPCQFEFWHGIGLRNLQQAGMHQSFRWIDELPSVAIPLLQKEDLKFDAIFIDGNHRFDDVLVEFTLSDMICNEGGFIILDDMWLPSIRKVVSFIDQNRSDYVRRTTPISNIAVYQKIGQDRRGWRHFVDF